jgi:regulatory protein
MASEDESKAALSRAYRLLSLRARSEEEIRRSLRHAGFGDAAIEAAVSHLLHQGLLDDRAFAANWTQSRIQSRPRGRRLIEHELRTKGVSPEDAAAATSGVDDDATALALAERRARLMGGVDRQTLVRRLSNYLLARGFSGETVSRAVASVLSGRDDS